MRDHLSQVLLTRTVGLYIREIATRAIKQFTNDKKTEQIPWNDLLLLYCCHLNNIRISIFFPGAKQKQSKRKWAQIVSIEAEQNVLTWKRFGFVDLWAKNSPIAWVYSVRMVCSLTVQHANTELFTVKLTLNWFRYTYIYDLYRYV